MCVARELFITFKVDLTLLVWEAMAVANVCEHNILRFHGCTWRGIAMQDIAEFYITKDLFALNCDKKHDGVLWMSNINNANK